MTTPTEITFAKRPEVTVSTMGRVHNPSGAGVAATSSAVKSKMCAKAGLQKNGVGNGAAEGGDPSPLDTRTKEEGSSRRNITRKKSAPESARNHKKQGGAGKNKWQLDDGSDAVYQPPQDEKDPLYDAFEDDQSKYVLASAGAPVLPFAAPTAVVGAAPVYGPALTLPEFKRRTDDALREFFDSGDADEVVRATRELGCGEYHAEIVKRAVGMSLDHGPRERELTSRLLARTLPELLTPGDVHAGFEKLCASVGELAVDVPDATAAVGAFMARAVVDDMLPPAFLVGRDGAAVDHARRLLSREHCSVRMEKVWGPGDGRSVPELKESMDQLLKEYLLSRELDEAACCVQEINEPLFHHELVKRGIRAAAETGDDEDVAAMWALLEFLVKNSITSEGQLAKGFARSQENLDDLKLDVPGASVVFGRFVQMAVTAGMLPADYQC